MNSGANPGSPSTTPAAATSVAHHHGQLSVKMTEQHWGFVSLFNALTADLIPHANLVKNFGVANDRQETTLNTLGTRFLGREGYTYLEVLEQKEDLNDIEYYGITQAYISETYPEDAKSVRQAIVKETCHFSALVIQFALVAICRSVKLNSEKAKQLEIIRGVCSEILTMPWVTSDVGITTIEANHTKTFVTMILTLMIGLDAHIKKCEEEFKQNKLAECLDLLDTKLSLFQASFGKILLQLISDQEIPPDILQNNQNKQAFAMASDFDEYKANPNVRPALKKFVGSNGRFQLLKHLLFAPELQEMLDNLEQETADQTRQRIQNPKAFSSKSSAQIMGSQSTSLTVAQRLTDQAAVFSFNEEQKKHAGAFKQALGEEDRHVLLVRNSLPEFLRKLLRHDAASLILETKDDKPESTTKVASNYVVHLAQSFRDYLRHLALRVEIKHVKKITGQTGNQSKNLAPAEIDEMLSNARKTLRNTTMTFEKLTKDNTALRISTELRIGNYWLTNSAVAVRHIHALTRAHFSQITVIIEESQRSLSAEEVAENTAQAVVSVAQLRAHQGLLNDAATPSSPLLPMFLNLGAYTHAAARQQALTGAAPLNPFLLPPGTPSAPSRQLEALPILPDLEEISQILPPDLAARLAPNIDIINYREQIARLIDDNTAKNKTIGANKETLAKLDHSQDFSVRVFKPSWWQLLYVTVVGLVIHLGLMLGAAIYRLAHRSSLKKDRETTEELTQANVTLVNQITQNTSEIARLTILSQEQDELLRQQELKALREQVAQLSSRRNEPRTQRRVAAPVPPATNLVDDPSVVVLELSDLDEPAAPASAPSPTQMEAGRANVAPQPSRAPSALFSGERDVWAMDLNIQNSLANAILKKVSTTDDLDDDSVLNKMLDQLPGEKITTPSVKQSIFNIVRELALQKKVENTAKQIVDKLSYDDAMNERLLETAYSQIVRKPVPTRVKAMVLEEARKLAAQKKDGGLKGLFSGIKLLS